MSLIRRETSTNVWRIWPERYTVTLQSPGVSDRTVTEVRRKRASRGESLDDAAFGDEETMIWQIWINQIPSGNPPLIDDVIVGPDGVKWVITDRVLSLFEQCYNLTCMRHR